MNRQPQGQRPDTMVLLLAGGQGERLHPLTRRHAKPAVPFAGLYRIIDFTLSNCINSDLKRIFVLTQHKSLSLDRHLRTAWGMLRPQLGEFVQAVPPQRALATRWYAGTADAVFQNLHLLEEERPARLLLVSGDHVYHMDYRRLIEFHVERGAAATIACTEVPLAEAKRMGVVGVDDDARVESFIEKPQQPVPLPHDRSRALANMGVYVFETAALVRAVIEDEKSDSEHDFGRNILPAMVASQPVFAWDVSKRGLPRERYWKDVGTLDSYYEANLGLLVPKPPFDLFDADWPLRADTEHHPPTVVRDDGCHAGRVSNSLVSPGARIDGGSIARSIVSPRVTVGSGATVEESILLPGVRVGAGAVVRRAIVDENVTLPCGTRIGTDAAADRRRFVVTPAGVVVVPGRVALD
ncbi:glucose-1-phosphate adenylyltransferase [Candidatus Binatia bacterium]|nr:glucose-1-phosphate adenylyltransferase [Candidatus Binatia bacterium]